MDDDSTKPPEQLRQELANLRQQRAVEQAAERIREAVLAMRKSEDLMDVVGVMHQTLHQLGVNPATTSISFIDEAEGQAQHYFAEKDLQSYGYVPSVFEGWNLHAAKEVEGGFCVRWNTAPLSKMAAALVHGWREGRIATSVERMSPELMRQWWYPLDPEKSDGLVLEPLMGEWTVTLVPFAHGTVGYRERVFSEEHVALVQALTETLSLGYLRFLDFQQMEDQNRQARLEAAVQEVRAEVLAMRQADDLDRIVALVWQSLGKVGVVSDGLYLSLTDEASGRTISRQILHNDVVDLYPFPRIVRDIVPGATLAYPVLTESELFEKYGMLDSQSTIVQIGNRTPDHAQASKQTLKDDWGADWSTEFIQSCATIYVVFSRGNILFFRRQNFAEDDLHIAEAFTEVVDLAFSRVLDFQRLEEQAKILEQQAAQDRRERAVERVRAEALAMLSSDDLLKVVGVMYQEMIDLEAVDRRTQLVIRFVDEQADRQISYYARLNPRTFGVSWISSDLVEFNENVVVMARHEDSVWHFERFREGKEWTDSHNRGVDILHKDIIEKAGGDHLPPAYIEAHMGETTRTHIPFEYGVVGMTQDKYREERVNLLRDFTGALSFGFLRFLDFQRLEKQAQQARRERALERVRAEAMAMKSSDDLLKVVAVLSQEMTKLDIESPQTAIALIDEDSAQLIFFSAMWNPVKFGYSWSSPSWIEYDPNTIVGILTRSSLKEMNERTKVMVEYWKNREVRVHEWVADRSVVAAVLRDTGLAVDEGYTDSFMAWIEGKLVVNIPFEYGWISFTQQGRNEEQETIVRELAGALSLGYLRFLDFQQLEEQYRELEQAQEALVRSESLAAIGTLAAGAAHELNNPIGAAASLVQSVQEMVEEDTAEELEADRSAIVDNLAFSRKELDRAKAIVASLLDLSRPQDYTEAVDLKTVAQDALRGLYSRYDADRVTIEEVYQAALPTVQGNFAQLVQVALNLMGNALDALGSDKGTVALKTYTDGDNVVFECGDTGVGMSDQVRQDIFKPFFTTKAPGEGTGLGLYVAHQIVDKHGGTIEVDSAEGQGTIVRVRLPDGP